MDYVLTILVLEMGLLSPIHESLEWTFFLLEFHHLQLTNDQPLDIYSHFDPHRLNNLNCHHRNQRSHSPVRLIGSYPSLNHCKRALSLVLPMHHYKFLHDYNVYSLASHKLDVDIDLVQYGVHESPANNNLSSTRFDNHQNLS